MLFTVYERACAVAEVDDEPLSLVLSQVMLPDMNSPVMQRAMYSYVVKMGLIRDKNDALDNIMKTIDNMTTSSNDIIAMSTEYAQKAFRYRQNLELSVLESQVKQIEIEIASLKNLTASEFTAKYGS